jgi:hypothetical protein
MTTKTLFLTSQNYKDGKLIYNFPTPQKFDHHEVGVASVSIYNSFFNITNDNNQIKFQFPTGIGNAYYNL